MGTQYITLTLELGGYNDDAMHDIHTQLREILAAWRMLMAYAELRITYQDNDQVSPDADVDPVVDTWID